MSLLRTVLRQLHLIEPFDEEEIDKASAENALHDHDATMRRLDTADREISNAQGRLREAVSLSRSSSESAQAPPRHDEIAQLVHDMRSFGQRQGH
ncbi:MULTISPECIES: hypothetical protein [unclassified Bradyrhizobium]|uniref:hypothetical protein n=1 Tax=Bradyrhizobium sp. USDA 4541 TaxID=2817704 RepID=UPI0020A59E9A|nr:hypothetical protein [Bradyrhizobium sp. USDA 4541]MCP1852768.1 hypothetical protein [Bradyrhizobium sp. USDA 4541]